MKINKQCCGYVSINWNISGFYWTQFSTWSDATFLVHFLCWSWVMSHEPWILNRQHKRIRIIFDMCFTSPHIEYQYQRNSILFFFLCINIRMVCAIFTREINYVVNYEFSTLLIFSSVVHLVWRLSESFIHALIRFVSSVIIYCLMC